MLSDTNGAFELPGLQPSASYVLRAAEPSGSAIIQLQTHANGEFQLERVPPGQVQLTVETPVSSGRTTIEARPARQARPKSLSFGDAPAEGVRQVLPRRAHAAGA
ncbi:MAG TPA: hypothetical protein VFN67_13895, partial [Polyangiales bacterium]|nr:hypothetical protein [Polyangiales bacterium]